MAEAVLLGNVALRVGKKIQWDSKKLKVTNVADANQYLRKDYRTGWTAMTIVPSARRAKRTIAECGFIETKNLACRGACW
jgi:hypothetical protein